MTQEHPHRGAQLRLLLAVLRRLATGGWRVEDLAADLGISRRTAYRVVRELVKAELPMDVERHGREVSYRLAERWWEPRATARRKRQAKK